MRIIRPSAEGGYTHATELPPRYQLAAHDLSTHVIKAWKRDINQQNMEADAAITRLAVGRWKQNPWDRVAMLISRLISVFWWRRAFLKNPKVSDQTADDEFAVSAASALDTILKPWIKGKKDLDYQWLGNVLALASAFGKHPSPGGQI
jgi:hypothetical protein